MDWGIDRSFPLNGVTFRSVTSKTFRNRLLYIVPILGMIAALVAFFFLRDRAVAVAEIKPAAPIRFGFSLDTVQLLDTVVPHGTTFAGIMGSLGWASTATHKLVQASQGVFDLRGLRAGRPLHLVRDTTGRLKHLIYEHDAFQWVRFELDTAAPKVVRGSHHVDTVDQTVGGTIELSLWNNLTAQGHSPELVGKVADILAWQVDFFSVQPGDKFRVVYKEFVVDGKAVGVGDIEAVSFEQGGRLSKAYLFRHADKGGYYDANGSPCKRQFLKAPLQFSRISSHFSRGRMHPVLRIVRPHHGVDYAAPSGTPVMSVGDGTVIARGWDFKGGGNYVKIRHNATFSTCYMHLKGIAGHVRNGARIGQGEVVGWVGSTGLSTGPHLDFRFFRDGRPVNPLTVEPPPAPPLPDALRTEFLAHAAKISATLDAVAADFRPAPVSKS